MVTEPQFTGEHDADIGDVPGSDQGEVWLMILIGRLNRRLNGDPPTDFGDTVIG